MTWEEVRDLDRAGAVGVLPVGAVEAHGPHLPLSTDVIIAEAMARACADELEAASRTALVLPPLWYSSAGFAAGFPGTISVTGAVVSSTIVDVARSLGEQDVATLAVANAHLDPGHLAALRDAVAAAPRAYFGWPAEATAEEGRQTVRILGALLAEAVLETGRHDAGGDST